MAGIRALLGLRAATQPSRAERIDCVKMGTTVATNALLERTGARTLLVITRGLSAMRCASATQARPRLFDRHIVLPEPLYERVLEADERVDAAGGVFVPLDEPALAAALARRRRRRLRACAIVFMHGYRYPEHERQAARWRAPPASRGLRVARVSPLMKLGAARRHHGRRRLSVAGAAPLRGRRCRELDAGRAPAVHAELAAA